MRQDDLFTIAPSDSFPGTTTTKLNRSLMERAVKGPIPAVDDLEFADVLVRVVRNELSTFGSGRGSRVDDDDMQLLLQTSNAVCSRSGVSFPSLPFRDLSRFRSHWIADGMSNSYAARRDYIERVFSPLQHELFRLTSLERNDRLLDAVSPHPSIGWPTIDLEIAELRRRFAASRTEQDHCAIGAACVRIIECLGDVAFDEQRHVPADGVAPDRGRTKDRFDLIISCSLVGSENERMRRFARSLVEITHDVKHSKTPSRMEAGIAADGVICLANMLRRITTN